MKNGTILTRLYNYIVRIFKTILSFMRILQWHKPVLETDKVEELLFSKFEVEDWKFQRMRVSVWTLDTDKARKKQNNLTTTRSSKNTSDLEETRELISTAGGMKIENRFAIFTIKVFGNSVHLHGISKDSKNIFAANALILKIFRIEVYSREYCKGRGHEYEWIPQTFLIQVIMSTEQEIFSGTPSPQLITDHLTDLISQTSDN